MIVAAPAQLHGYAISRIMQHYPRLDPHQVEQWLHHGSFASPERRFFYMAVPKAACTAFKLVLRSIGGSPAMRDFSIWETRRDMFVHDRANVPFPPITTLPESVQRDLLESRDVLRFTVVRNPHARLLSAWRGKVFLCEPGADVVYRVVRGERPGIDGKQPVRFEEFVQCLETQPDRVRNGHWEKQVHLAFPAAIDYGHVGRCERLPETADVVGRHLGYAGPVPLPHVNESALQPPAPYSAELAARVHTLFAEDFSAFGYDPADWPADGDQGDWDAWLTNHRRIVDALIERNLVIGHLYRERERLTSDMAATYHWSLARVRNKVFKMAQRPR